MKRFVWRLQRILEIKTKEVNPIIFSDSIDQSSYTPKTFWDDTFPVFRITFLNVIVLFQYK